MIIRLGLVACSLVAAVCSAATLEGGPIPPNSTLSGFGSSEVYRGETFRVPVADLRFGKQPHGVCRSNKRLRR